MLTVEIINTLSRFVNKILSNYAKSVCHEYPVTDEDGNILYYEIYVLRSPRVTRVTRDIDSDKEKSK